MKIKNKLTARITIPKRTSKDLSKEDSKRLSDFFILLMEIDQEMKRNKKSI